MERLRPRGTGLTELDLTPEVNALRDAIIARNPGMKADDLRPTTWLEESFVALQKDLDVLGESRDTVYLRNGSTFSLADDEFVMVYGVNHEKTGKATYANFAAYNVCKACPYGGENSLRVAGSAFDYFPDVKNRPAHVDSSLMPGNWLASAAEIHAARRFLMGTAPRASTRMAKCSSDSELTWSRQPRSGQLSRNCSTTEFCDSRLRRPDHGRYDHARNSEVREGGVLQGTPVDVKFRVNNVTATSITWTATLKGDDGCGELTPSTKTVASGEETSTRLTVPATQNSTLTLFLNATDAKGRRAKTLGYQLKFFGRRHRHQTEYQTEMGARPREAGSNLSRSIAQTQFPPEMAEPVFAGPSVKICAFGGGTVIDFRHDRKDPPGPTDRLDLHLDVLELRSLVIVCKPQDLSYDSHFREALISRQLEGLAQGCSVGSRLQETYLDLGRLPRKFSQDQVRPVREALLDRWMRDDTPRTPRSCGADHFRRVFGVNAVKASASGFPGAGFTAESDRPLLASFRSIGVVVSDVTLTETRFPSNRIIPCEFWVMPNRSFQHVVPRHRAGSLGTCGDRDLPRDWFTQPTVWQILDRDLHRSSARVHHRQPGRVEGVVQSLRSHDRRQKSGLGNRIQSRSCDHGSEVRGAEISPARVA